MPTAAAADLAALGAAGRLVEGTERACETAADIARRMGAELHVCRAWGWDMLVTVRVTTGLPLGIGGAAATGRARAGPVMPLR